MLAPQKEPGVPVSTQTDLGAKSTTRPQGALSDDNDPSSRGLDDGADTTTVSVRRPAGPRNTPGHLPVRNQCTCTHAYMNAHGSFICASQIRR